MTLLVYYLKTFCCHWYSDLSYAKCRVGFPAVGAVILSTATGFIPLNFFFKAETCRR